MDNLLYAAGSVCGIFIVVAVHFLYSLAYERYQWNNGICRKDGTPWEFCYQFKGEKIYRSKNGEGLIIRQPNKSSDSVLNSTLNDDFIEELRSK